MSWFAVLLIAGLIAVGALTLMALVLDWQLARRYEAEQRKLDEGRHE